MFTQNKNIEFLCCLSSPLSDVILTCYRHIVSFYFNFKTLNFTKDQDETNEEVYKELLVMYLIEDETLVFYTYDSNLRIISKIVIDYLGN
jgi:hypothetical protein